MKMGTMKTALPDSLAEADLVYCYSGGVDWDVATALCPLKNKVQIIKNMPALIETILAEAKSGDHILIMSNGSFGGIHQQLLEGLQQH